jgi:adenylate kinase family enzyme
MAEQVPPLLEVVEHYRRSGALRTIDGRRPITDVGRDTIDILEAETGSDA